MSVPSVGFDGMDINDGTIYAILPGADLGATTPTYSEYRSYAGTVTQANVSTANLVQMSIPMKVGGTSVADLGANLEALNVKIRTATAAAPHALIFDGVTYSVVSSPEINPPLTQSYQNKFFAIVDMVLNRLPTASGVPGGGGGGGWLPGQYSDDPSNVKYYGAVGDGVTDDSAAFSAAIAYAQAQASSTALNGDQAGNVALYVPPGEYLITQPNTLLDDAYDTKTAGLMIRGAGRFLSRIRYEPVSPGGYLAYNNDAWLFLGFADLSFYSDDDANGFLYSYSVTGGAQNYTFERVNWDGAWADVLRLEGSNNNSEWSFHHCGVYGSVVNFLHVPDSPDGSDQFVNYNFFACQFWVSSGNFVNMLRGGSINVWGGSFIYYGAGGYLFLLPQTGGAYGTQRLSVVGPTIELRSREAKLCAISWNMGTVEFVSCDMSTNNNVWGVVVTEDSATVTFTDDPAQYFEIGDELCGYGITAGTHVDDMDETTITMSAVAALDSTGIGNATRTTAEFTDVGGGQCLVKFEGCKLMGRHEYTYASTSYLHRTSIVYQNCELLNHAEPHEFISFVPASAHTNYGSAPPVTFSGCRSLMYDAAGVIEAGGSVVLDTTLGFIDTMVAVAERKVVSLKTAWATGPEVAQTLTVTLPLHSVITRTIMKVPAGDVASGASVSFTLQTTEGSPTVLSTATANPFSAGFYVDTTLCHQCTSDDTRTLELVTTGADWFAPNALFLIEYI